MKTADELHEYITELLFDDEDVWEVITAEAHADLKARGILEHQYPNQLWRELILMGQMKFLTIHLMAVASKQLG